MAIIANDKQNFREISNEQLHELLELLETSSYEGRQKELNKLSIGIFCITQEDYERVKINLLANQIGIGSAANPSYKEIWKDIKRKTKE